MIQTYSDFIQKLVGAIANNEEFSWADFGHLMGNSVMLVLFTLFILTALIFVFGCPVGIYRKLSNSFVKKIEAAFKKQDTAEYLKLKNRATLCKIAYWVLFVIVYLPIALPILLMLVNIVF